MMPGSFDYRLSGEFAVAGRPVNAPRQTVSVAVPLTIMTHQVSSADYDRCVAQGACEKRGGRDHGRADMPAVGVSWQDATAYAQWFSRETGQSWRLPTDAEWAYAAGSRFADDSIVADDGADSFAKRWLAKYDQESDRGAASKTIRPFGSFGANEHGLLDMSGNVWEWTSTCYSRQALGEKGQAGERTVNCGVRVVEGQHRAYVTDFIRDARAGGCAVGIPPANLGFRLVREDLGKLDGLVARLRARVQRSA
jgi:formylglycine-generating enzyme required for sulfatase activity